MAAVVKSYFREGLRGSSSSSSALGVFRKRCFFERFARGGKGSGNRFAVIIS